MGQARDHIQRRPPPEMGGHFLGSSLFPLLKRLSLSSLRQYHHGQKMEQVRGEQTGSQNRRGMRRSCWPEWTMTPDRGHKRSAEQLELDGAQGQRATWSGAAAVLKRQPLPVPESLQELNEDLRTTHGEERRGQADGGQHRFRWSAE